MDVQFLTFTSWEYFDFFSTGWIAGKKFEEVFSGPHLLIALYSGMGVTNDERDDLAVLDDKDSHSTGV